MTTYMEIKSDWMQARKEREKDKASFLGTLKSDIDRASKDSQKEIDESMVQQILKKYQKGLTQTIELSDDAKAKYELRILESYIPKMMNEKELRTIILEMPASYQMKDIMSELKRKYAGQVDMKMASRIAKEL